jgi:hypothetical protein
MGKEVRFMMHPVRTLADYNFSGFINKALKIVQKQDGSGELGQRSIMLSKHPTLLAGFQLNKNTTFDSVVRTPLTYTVDRQTLSARVNIPALLRDINFHPNNRHARFCIDVSLGIVPDFTFDPKEGAYTPPAWYTSMFAPKSVSSPWYPALKGSPATSLEIALTDQVPADESYSLMLTVGVRYGSPMEDDVVEEVKRAGAAKVVAIAGRPEGDGSEDKQPVNVTMSEEAKGEGEKRSTVSVQSAAACTYGWHYAAAIRSGEAIPQSAHAVKAEIAIQTPAGVVNKRVGPLRGLPGSLRLQPVSVTSSAPALTLGAQTCASKTLRVTLCGSKLFASRLFQLISEMFYDCFLASFASRSVMKPSTPIMATIATHTILRLVKMVGVTSSTTVFCMEMTGPTAIRPGLSGMLSRK